MNPFGSIIGRGSDGPNEPLDDPGTYDPERLPDPGPFLADARLLTGGDHLAVHGLVREAFEERGVYDATFGYNLAALNRDRRHPDAGLRYGVTAFDGREADGGSTPTDATDATGAEALRVEFTPTTPFCPQGESLARGAFAALNGLDDRHGYAVVRVRLRGHRAADAVNDDLRRRAARYLETGSVPGADRAAGDD